MTSLSNLKPPKSKAKTWQAVIVFVRAYFSEVGIGMSTSKCESSLCLIWRESEDFGKIRTRRRQSVWAMIFVTWANNGLEIDPGASLTFSRRVRFCKLTTRRQSCYHFWFLCTTGLCCLSVEVENLEREKFFGWTFTVVAVGVIVNLARNLEITANKIESIRSYLEYYWDPASDPKKSRF